MKKNYRNRVILIVALLILSVNIAVADLLPSPTKIDLSIPEQIPQEFYSESLTLNNDFSNFNISDMTFIFTPDNDVPNNNMITSDFTIDFSGLTIGKQSSSTIDYDIKIPKGIPAIDEDDDKLKTKTWQVGTLRITGKKINFTDGTDNGQVTADIPVNVEVTNKLTFYKGKIELEINDDDPVNVSNGIIKSPHLNDDLRIIVRYENSYDTNDFNFDGNDIQATLFINDDEIETTTGDEDVGYEEVGTASFSFDLNDYNVGDNLDVKIELTGEDNFGSLHGELFEFKLDVQDEEDIISDELLDTDEDGITDDVDLCPSTPPGCIVEFDGCRIDFDGDGIKDCTGSFNKPKENEKQTTQTNDVNTQTKKTTEEPKQKEEVKQEQTTNNTGSDKGATSFIFGLVVGVVGASLFFILTKE